MNSPSRQHRLPIVILISGRGSNMQSILEAVRQNRISAEVRAIISNNPDAPGLEVARRAGFHTEVLDHRGYTDRQAYDRDLQNLIDQFKPGLVVLAGYMRILTPGCVNHYLGRMLNIHPALLPAFPGLNTHERALEAGIREHGASVHFVTPEVDAGPVVIHGRVPVLSGDSSDTLASRVLEQEHRIYPVAIHWFVQGRLKYHDGKALLDGQVLPAGGVLYEGEPDNASSEP